MASAVELSPRPLVHDRERFYTANETLDVVASQMLGEMHPDPEHKIGSSSSRSGSDSHTSYSLGDPVDSDNDVSTAPQISIPNNTISAKITFVIPSSDGVGTKTIDYPLDIDLSKPPKPPRDGRLPTYEVNIPVVMGNQKIQTQEMTRDVSAVEAAEDVSRKESDTSMCSFNAWSFASCCHTEKQPVAAPPSKSDSQSGRDRFRTIFEGWPGTSGHAASEPGTPDCWGTNSKPFSECSRPPNVPPIPEIKSIDVRAGGMEAVSTPKYASAESHQSISITPRSVELEESKSPNLSPKHALAISNVLKPMNPESYYQGTRGPHSTRPGARRAADIDYMNPRVATWTPAKELESPRLTGGYGETAVDVISEAEEEKACSPVVVAEDNQKSECPTSARRSGPSFINGIGTVGRRISEGIQSIGRKLTFTPTADISVPDGEDPLSPGIGWVPRPDEVGEGVKTVAELKEMLNGTWIRDAEQSEDMEPALDCMEMPWLMKRAVIYANQTEIKVYNDRIYVIPKLFGISAPQESFFGRKGRIQARRDRRKGPSRIALVPTKTGVRQYNQWGEPYQGISLMEIDLAEDGKTLISKVTIKRKTGESAIVRTLMHRRK